MKQTTTEQKAKKAAYDAEYRKKNAERRRINGRKYYHENKERYKEKHSERATTHKPALYNLKARCTAQDIPFDLTYEYLLSIIPERCPIFNTELKHHAGKLGGTDTSYSVDRINPNLGYVKGNVQVISNKANRMKSDASPEELIMFANWILKTYTKEST